MANNDEARFRQLMQEHGQMIARFAAGFERDRHARDDLAQDIMLAVWQALPAFRGEASMKTYILGIAQRRCASHVMKAVARPAHEELSEDWVDPRAGPETVAGSGQQRRRLLSAVRALPGGQRQLVMLALEGVSIDDMATMLGISKNHVSVRLNRAKAALNERLGA